MNDSVDYSTADLLDRLFNYLCGLGEELIAYSRLFLPIYYSVLLLLLPLRVVLFLLGVSIDFEYSEPPKPLLQRLKPGVLRGPWLFIFLLPLLLVHSFQNLLLKICFLPLCLLLIWLFWAIIFRVPILALSARGSLAMALTILSLSLLVWAFRPASSFFLNMLSSLFSSNLVGKHHTAVTFLILLFVFSYLASRMLIGKQVMAIDREKITSKGLANPIVANALAIGTFLLAKNTLVSAIATSVINSVFVRAIVGVLFESLALFSVRMSSLVRKQHVSKVQFLDLHGDVYPKSSRMGRDEKTAILFSLLSWFCVIWLILDLVVVWFSVSTGSTTVPLPTNVSPIATPVLTVTPTTTPTSLPMPNLTNTLMVLPTDTPALPTSTRIPTSLGP